MGVLLNIDAGEYPDEPPQLYRVAHIVSIACGAHAGDDASMENALLAAAAGGAEAGAHPSYVDRAGFGRRAQTMAPGALEATIRAQCARLASHAHRHSVSLRYVKPHGALYHSANHDAEIARAVVSGARAAMGTFTLIGPPAGALVEVARASEIPFLREGFADRQSRPDGTLVPRDEPGALITDPSAAALRAVTLARSGAIDTICVHGDTPSAVLIARAVRQVVDEARR